MEQPKPQSRLSKIKEGFIGGLPKRGRYVVSIDRVMEDPANERKTFRDMDQLVESVRLHGIIEPITVTQEGERYRILTGHRRYRAAKTLGLPEVEVLVRDPEAATSRRFKSLISNIQRENIAPVELAETLRALLEDAAVPTQRELARQVGKSEQWLSGMLRLLELPARIQEQLRSPGIPVGYEMAQRIAQVSDPVVQQELVDAALAGEKTRSIRHRIDTHRADQPKEKGRTTSAIVRLSHRHGPCIATVKTKREEGSKEAMLEALRELTQQVREDDSLR